MPVSDMLKDARERQGLSLREVARRAGLSHVYVRRVEMGDPCTVATAAALATAVGGDADEWAREARIGSVRAKAHKWAVSAHAAGLTEDDAVQMIREQF